MTGVATSVELVVFTGLQAAGKTSFYRERFTDTHLHVSKDAWPNARRREARQRRIVETALRDGRSVVVDNTNPTPNERAPLVAIARTVGVRVSCYAFVVSVEDALRRNAAREGRARIVEAGIFFVAARLVAPSADEGFDQLFEVRGLGHGFDVRDVSPVRRSRTP